MISVMAIGEQPSRKTMDVMCALFILGSDGYLYTK
jgi:hypothetical protein